jgi:hypothetical protein
MTNGNKPDWCPQDVWNDTGMQFDKLYDAEPDLEGGCEISIRTMAALMVMEERERAANLAFKKIEELGRRGSIARFIASAIRSD